MPLPKGKAIAEERLGLETYLLGNWQLLFSSCLHSDPGSSVSAGSTEWQ